MDDQIRRAIAFYVLSWPLGMMLAIVFALLIPKHGKTGAAKLIMDRARAAGEDPSEDRVLTALMIAVVIAGWLSLITFLWGFT